MKKLIYYTIASYAVIWAAQLAGLNTMVAYAASFMVPPVLLVAWIVFRSRGIEQRTRKEYWSRRERYDPTPPELPADVKGHLRRGR